MNTLLVKRILIILVGIIGSVSTGYVIGDSLFSGEKPAAEVLNTVGKYQIIAVDIMPNGAQVIEMKDVTTGDSYLILPGVGLTKK